MSFSEDKFRDHISEVIRQTANDSERPLTLSELKELAESMGVTEREWNDLMIKAENALNLAVGHLKVENYTDAIQCAEEATSLNPYIKDGNAILAQSYYKLGIVDKNDALFSKAEHYARMELKNDPLDTIAVNVLSAIESIKGEGTYSKKLIRTIAFVAGGAILIFLLLYMCRNSMQEDETKNYIQETINGNPDARLSSLKLDADKTQKTYISAIERRNQDALEVVAFIADESIKQEFTKTITEYNYSEIGKSEQTYRLTLSEVKRQTTINSDLETRLEGGDNRINTAKKRYLEAVANYNSVLDQFKNEVGNQFDPIEELK